MRLSPGSPGALFFSQLIGRRPRVAFFCATYLKPEMHHVHRQIAASTAFDPIVITQKLENADVFPFNRVHLVRRKWFRAWGRAVERYVTGHPWQVSGREGDAVLNLLREESVGALHVFFGNVAVHFLPLLRRLPIPFVVSFHGADVTGAIASDGYAGARAELFDRAAWVVCRSEALVERVAAMGCPREKLRVVRTVVPEVEFVERAETVGGPIQLVQASRLIPKKGLATTLRAFARLETPRAQLVIAGTGPMERELRALAAELGVAERVRFPGFLDQIQLKELFHAAHVFVHPSEAVAGDTEGVPNAMLEAMASGLPVVATRHGGIPEVITDGENGLLCNEGDAEGLAGAIARLVEDERLYAKVAVAGFATVRDRYSKTALRRVLTEIYGGEDSP